MAYTVASTLECQECGVVVRHLTPDEARQVAADPYRFVVYCRACAALRAYQLGVEG